jgi:5-oxoprolinase (ATP-hydrolysing)
LRSDLPSIIDTLIRIVSQDPNNYRDAPTEGIRRVLEKVLEKTLPRGEKLNTDKIGTLGRASAQTLEVFMEASLEDFIRLSTTVATNALLERKGQKHALAITKGFKVLSHILTNAPFI